MILAVRARIILPPPLGWRLSSSSLSSSSSSCRCPPPPPPPRRRIAIIVLCGIIAAVEKSLLLRITGRTPIRRAVDVGASLLEGHHCWTLSSSVEELLIGSLKYRPIWLKLEEGDEERTWVVSECIWCEEYVEHWVGLFGFSGQN